jgi:hypothetical protein
MKLIDWVLVEVALLLIGLIKISKSQTKSGFDNPSQAVCNGPVVQSIEEIDSRDLNLQ